MDRRCIVRITVPTHRDANDDGGGRHGASGTAYPVDDNLFLTAKHVVDQPTRAPDYPIKIHWLDYKCSEEVAAEDVILLKDDPSLGFEETLDAALVRCRRPPGVPLSRGIVDEHLPAPGAGWESEGFPAFGDFGSGREAVPFSGEVYGTTENRPSFFVRSPVVPRDDSKWPGLSGAPVFSGGRIIGIVQKANSNADQLLKVTPGWRIARSPTFREALGWQDPCRAKREKLLAHLNELIGSEFTWQRDLRRAIERGELSHGAIYATPVECLLTHDLKEIFIGLVDVWKRANKAAPQLGTGDRGDEDVLTFASTLLALRGCEKAAAVIQSHITRRDAAIVNIEAFHRAAVECAMAAYDGRPAAFRPVMRDGQQPAIVRDAVGKYALDQAPESGFSSGQELRGDDVLAYLLDTFAPVELFGDDREERIAAANDEIGSAGRVAGATHYIHFGPFAVKDAVAQSRAAEAEILRPFTNVICVEGTARADLSRLERGFLSLFLNMVVSESDA